MLIFQKTHSNYLSSFIFSVIRLETNKNFKVAENKTNILFFELINFSTLLKNEQIFLWHTVIVSGLIIKGLFKIYKVQTLV